MSRTRTPDEARRAVAPEVGQLDGLNGHAVNEPPEMAPWPESPNGHAASVVAGPTRTLADINAEFWDARPGLATIRDFARARRVGPWALLAEVLARVVVAVAPSVQLPPLIGAPASLNLFFGIVAPSGTGKGGAAGVAREVIDVGQEIIGRGIGSGEGIPKLFVDPQTDGTVERISWAELISIAEIDSLAAQVGRSGGVSTLTPQLRQAWIGESLGFHYANKDKRTHVPAHSYRLCLVAGVQPKRAGVLFGDEGGGTPQRFIWWPAMDAEIPDVRPPEPKPLVWGTGLVETTGGLRIPRSDIGPGPEDDAGWLLPVCDEAAGMIDRAAVMRHRGDVEALDGHSLLCREKLAAALALFDCHAGVRAEDWHLAGLGMLVSDMTRQLILDELGAEARAQNEAAGFAEASRARIVANATERDAIAKTAGKIAAKLARVDGWISRGKLRASLSSSGREYFDEAIDLLISQGRAVRRNTTPGHGEMSDEYALAGR